MLVLSRKKDESIVINNDITIVVVEIRGDKVRLGVEAPKEVPVHRREVFDAIARGEQVSEPVVVESLPASVGRDAAVSEAFGAAMARDDESRGRAARKDKATPDDQPAAG